MSLMNTGWGLCRSIGNVYVVNAPMRGLELHFWPPLSKLAPGQMQNATITLP